MECFNRNSKFEDYNLCWNIQIKPVWIHFCLSKYTSQRVTLHRTYLDFSTDFWNICIQCPVHAQIFSTINNIICYYYFANIGFFFTHYLVQTDSEWF